MPKGEKLGNWPIRQCSYCTKSFQANRHNHKYCLACQKAKPWRDPDKRREQHLQSKYKLTSRLYEEMYTEQGGMCKVCARPGNSVVGRMPVDHDHQSGKVRGLLCSNCNLLIGMSGDSPARLLQAAAYLILHGKGLPYGV